MVQMRKWRPLLRLEEGASQATYRKIAEGLVNAILEGRLPPGTLLPGTREMAHLLDVNRKTVILAYEEAMTKGWLTRDGGWFKPTTQGFDFLSDLQAMFLPE